MIRAPPLGIAQPSCRGPRYRADDSPAVYVFVLQPPPIARHVIGDDDPRVIRERVAEDHEPLALLADLADEGLLRTLGHSLINSFALHCAAQDPTTLRGRDTYDGRRQGRYAGGMAEDMDLTRQMARVVRAFLTEPDTPQYGFDLMELLEVSSGTLYPILTRLTKAGWLRLELEDIDPAAAKRPARRNYRLNSEGAAAAVRALERMQDVYRVPDSSRRKS